MFPAISVNTYGKGLISEIPSIRYFKNLLIKNR